MSNYRRLISYIYAYEGGIKGKNVGFAKLEVRNGQCKIQVNVRNVYIGSQDTGVYLLSGSEEILVGRIFIRNGAGEFRAVVGVTNVAGSGQTIDQCYGLTVHNLSDSWQCYTTIWEDAVAHAAEVVLEEATSERVQKEEPVEGAVAKAVEEEIEAQSRKEEEAQKQEDMPSPSSVIPPEELGQREILRPADMGVMEIRPMEVLPIGKEHKPADLNRGKREEASEPAKKSKEAPEAAPENSEPIKKETELFQGGLTETEKQTDGSFGDVQAETQQIHKEQETGVQDPNPDSSALKTENPDRQEQKRQLRMQSMSQPGMQNNIQSQPIRPNQWGQTGMLFPPNWFARPNRQNRFVPPAGGRQMNDIRAGQHEVRLQPVSQEPESARQMGPGSSGPASGWQIQPNNGTGTLLMPESGPDSMDLKQKEPVLQSLQTSSPEQGQPSDTEQNRLPSAMENQPPSAMENPSQAAMQNQSQPVMQNQPQPDMENPSLAVMQDQPQTAGQNGPQTAGQSRPAETIQPEPNISEDEPKIDNVWQRFYKTYPKIQAFDYNGGCEILTIKPQDIGLLPRETWGYGNNSFLLHGYYNHRYLIFARLNNPKGRPRFLLGVPGHYYSNEKYMAAMFGFPNFVLSKVQPAGDDRFGYWYTDIRLGS